MQKKLSQKAHHFFIGGQNFKSEFKKQLRLLIIITLGFTIAFTWRQTIFDLVESLVVLVTHIQGSTSLSVLTSLFITIIAIIIIYLTSHFLKNRPDYI